MVVLEMACKSFIKNSKGKLLKEIQQLEKGEYTPTFKEDRSRLCEDFARLRLLEMDSECKLEKYTKFKCISFYEFLDQLILTIERNGTSQTKAIIPDLINIKNSFQKQLTTLK